VQKIRNIEDIVLAAEWKAPSGPVEKYRISLYIIILLRPISVGGENNGKFMGSNLINGVNLIKRQAYFGR
jgi:hypothetical protein